MNNNKKMLAVLSVPAIASLLAVAVTTPVKAANRDFYDESTTPYTVFQNSTLASNPDQLNKLIDASIDHPAKLVYEFSGKYYNYDSLYNSYVAAKAANPTATTSQDFTSALAVATQAPNPNNQDLTVTSVNALNATQAQVTFSAPVTASSVVPSDFKVTDANGNQLFISKAEVSSSDSKQVTLTFFDKFADKAAYTVVTSNVLDANAKAIKPITNSFAYVKAAVAKVEFTSTTLPAASTTDLSKYVRVTDALGRDVTSENTVSFTADKLVSPTGTLLATPADGDVAVVKATVNGTSVTANAVVTFKTQLANTLVGYTIAPTPSTVAADSAAFSKLASDKIVHYVSKSDATEKLGLYYNDQYGNSQPVQVGSGISVTNLTPNVVIVGADGSITPVSTGTGYVKVKYGSVEQTIEIDVRDDSSVAALSVDNANITAVFGANIPTSAKLTFKDQYGATVTPTAAIMSNVTATVNPGDENLLAVAKNSDGTLTLIPLKQGTTSVKVEYKDTTKNIDLVQNLQVTITNAAAVAGYKVETDTTKLDVNAANTSDTTDATNAHVKVYQVDANGNKIADVSSNAVLSIASGDTVSNKLVSFSAQQVNIDSDADNIVSYKPQNATVVVSLGSLQVGTVTFTVDNSTPAAATAVFTNNAISGNVGDTVVSKLKDVVSVSDQFGSSLSVFNKSGLTFDYKITNVNAVNLANDADSTINGVSILNNVGTADVVVTGIHYNGSANLLASPQVVKLSVKQQNPIVTNITVNGVVVTPDAETGLIDLSKFAGQDIFSSTGNLSEDATVTVTKDGATLYNKNVKTTDNFFTFVADGKINASTLASLDGATVTVTAGANTTHYTLKTAVH